MAAPSGPTTARRSSIAPSIRKRPSRSRTTRICYARGLIRPGNLELWVMNADGSNKHQVTHNGAANFAPYWLPDGKRIVFASNLANTKDPAGFDLYIIKGRHRPRTHHLLSRLRRLSDVFLRRQAPRVGLEPQRPRAARNQYLHRRLGRVAPAPITVSGYRL